MKNQLVDLKNDIKGHVVTDIGPFVPITICGSNRLTHLYDCAEGEDEDIAWLQVTIDHTTLVQERQSTCHLQT